MISEIDKDLVHILINVASLQHQSQGRELQGQPFRYASSGIYPFTQDKNDESLEAYKKTLLGDIK